MCGSLTMTGHLSFWKGQAHLSDRASWDQLRLHHHYPQGHRFLQLHRKWNVTCTTLFYHVSVYIGRIHCLVVSCDVSYGALVITGDVCSIKGNLCSAVLPVCFPPVVLAYPCGGYTHKQQLTQDQPAAFAQPVLLSYAAALNATLSFLCWPTALALGMAA